LRVVFRGIFFFNRIACRVREWTHVASVLRVLEEGKPLLLGRNYEQ